MYYSRTKIGNMEKFIYKGVVITYAGFKMEDKYCFYGYFENRLLYLSKTQIDQLEKCA